ncbi:polyketide synthase dehydratase domain-containing protein, partial [Streptomyces sp. NPDC015350]|uniref:polyketide synthase dehydratase domain-containing protein n=1 Tax=Streptomyces sp. NPDC015350 TaxID=3364955 RepID=UPI00370077DE
GQPLHIQTVAGPPNPDGTRTLTIQTRPETTTTSGTGTGTGDDTPWTRHATGTLTPHTPPTPTPHTTTWPPTHATPIDLTNLYPNLTHHGYTYGPAFQGLTHLWQHHNHLYAQITLPPHTNPDQHPLHPALLDATLHPLLATTHNTNPNTPNTHPHPDTPIHIPFTWNNITLHTTHPTTLRAHLTTTTPTTMSIEAVDDEGELVFSVGELVLMPASAEQLQATLRAEPSVLYRVDWTPVHDGGERDGKHGDERPDTGRRWAVLDGSDRSDGSDGSDGTSGADGADGTDGTDGSDRSGVLDALIDSDGRVPDVVFLPCGAPYAQAADVTTTAADVTDQGEAARTAVQAVLRTVQEWLSDDRFAAARLVVVTRGAAEAGPGEGVRDLAGAAVRGLVRSAQAENPDCFVLLDLDAELPRDLDRDRDLDSAPDFLRVALECGEPELAVRNGAVYATRLVKDNADDVLAPPDDTPHWRLGSTGTGTLENVALVPAPGAGEPLTGDRVRVAVRAVGANFRDVLIALGSYPGEAPMGSEGAGVVLEVGPDVTSVAVGDRVMGLFSEGAGPIAVTDGRTLARVPQGWTFAEAAATPIVFLTAYYGLVDLAGLRAGERLLVHSAAGGVGMAALQIARHLGAEVYGTASLGKWDALRRLGFDDEHLANSRTTDFETQFLATTDGHGMDVVLDSLAKEFVDASLRL